MSNAEREHRIERILVALDASPPSLAALRAAIELAQVFDAEVTGLFVEDINLVRLASVPFARELGYLVERSRPLDRRYIERQLRARARRAREALEEIAGEADVQWSFHVARGNIIAELLDAAAQADLTILGRAGWSLIGRRRLGSTTRAVLVETNRLTLILHEGTRLGLPVYVAYDGSQIGRQALAAGVSLLRGRDGVLSVLILADDPEAADDLEREAEDWLRQRDIEADFRHLIQPSVRRLTRLIAEEGCRVLVLPAPVPGISDYDLPDLFERVGCPIMLVR
jgi:nucleotide-binding universal stress UspA family protein